MTLFIDADACPVIKIALSEALKRKIHTFIVCDNTHSADKYPEAKCIICDKGDDSVDFVIANRINPGDIVITQDYGVAAMALAKNCMALNQNGLIFTENNIDSLLFSRHIGKKLRNSGYKTKGPSKRTKEDDEAFRKSLLELFSCI